ncbi:hypothetical protein SAMN05421806_103250 [Streptomyces indicus]|uniref:Uncharacterized protein n=1 Tax=Streptomyces indicus TaxID=417292 RepID=A0A1G8XKV0_9ACTN|nr:hypothetical protein SAMN05421806_103250 [Streptomyces indicus]
MTRGVIDGPADNDHADGMTETTPATLLSALPFAAHLGIALHEASAERATGTLAWSPGLCTVGGALHGGGS